MWKASVKKLLVATLTVAALSSVILIIYSLPAAAVYHEW
jgi:hypothetical protein